jgi:hypothetical protein
MIQLHPSDSKKFFHITIAQSEPELEIHRLKNDGFWKSVMLVHPGSLWFEPELNHHDFARLTRQNQINS